MDARAWTSLGVSAFLLVFVVLMLLFGQDWLNMDRAGQLDRLLMRAAESNLAIVGVVAVYCLLALTGFPQMLLFVPTMVVFGWQTGALYAWLGTMASATLTFFFGHLWGGKWVERIGGVRAQRTIDFLSRHGILASGLIRVVPSAPFVVVNAAAGAAHIPLWKYWLGTAIGIMPKIGVVAALAAFLPNGATLSEGVAGVVAFFQSRRPGDLALLAAIIVAWLGFLYLVRRVYLGVRRADAKGEGEK